MTSPTILRSLHPATTASPAIQWAAVVLTVTVALWITLSMIVGLVAS